MSTKSRRPVNCSAPEQQTILVIELQIVSESRFLRRLDENVLAGMVNEGDERTRGIESQGCELGKGRQSVVCLDFGY